MNWILAGSIATITSSTIASLITWRFQNYYQQKNAEKLTAIEHNYAIALADIKSKSDMGIEKVKGSVQLANVRYGHAFSRQAAAMERLYKQTLLLYKATKEYRFTIHDEAKRNAARQSFNTILHATFDMHLEDRIYLYDETAKLFLELFDQCYDFTQQNDMMQSYLRLNDRWHVRDYGQQIDESSDKIDATLKKIMGLMDAIVANFQAVLGIKETKALPN
ncbi:MAG TPA: hypothetical protein VG347_01210 [Verrucomicrobiae bacterium]|nr:hypothetical protein [Verrucomicrobiae bacterium]